MTVATAKACDQNCDEFRGSDLVLKARVAALPAPLAEARTCGSEGLRQIRAPRRATARVAADRTR